MARCHCLCIAHLADSLYVPWVSELTQQRFVHSPQLERRSYVHEKKKRDVRCLWCFVPWSLLSWAPQWWRGQCFGSCQNQEELFCHFPWPYWTQQTQICALHVSRLEPSRHESPDGLPEMFVRTRNHRQGIIKLRDFFPEYVSNMLLLASFSFFVLFQRRCTIWPATLTAFSTAPCHNPMATLWMGLWQGTFLAIIMVLTRCEMTSFFAGRRNVIHCNSLGGFPFCTGAFFLVCIKICFIMFQMFLLKIHHVSSSEGAPESCSDCDWFNGCVALRVGSLDVFEVMKVQMFWNPDGHKMGEFKSF